ncbi:AraC family transcriptional regulator [Psychroserpens sp.]|uniref:AraC family transcriptional regulator n=1 Tax=Psychroserpens sp. TaxID=2020870 RepID=UPI001B044E47|nr:AraC family transcriptional regulator [Psychroserpens sp.]MBO6605467.1 AraC family transcriptional regulator [Psychroserpens sp.]MBO6630379.1 AraC family transcriptional regulator [Psychroserpens sp.]MBO6653724.1 AraC family transcriptional regulator [Psychroserpens sp.]MBO6682045.1 AraC family transcriptional regulator [Psychroserpens sp.]MBO6748841.1 AraC family transcriptional regulator [Psychroserpens sp.]
MNLNNNKNISDFSDSKNIARGSFDETRLDDGFYVLCYQNNENEVQVVEREIDSRFIQFHFCIKGSSDFIFNNGNYRLRIEEENSLLLYNPQRDLPIHLDVHPNSWLVSILVSIKKFHGLFSQEADYITFLSEDNKDKKYYQDGKISPSMAIALNQIINYNLNNSIKSLYFRGKALELLSLYFNRSEDADIEQCPFLVDETNVIKIRKAKDIMISRMAEPPTLQELSDEIGLSLKKLKEGFKQIYGDSVFSFLFDYKMEVARKLLESGEHNVNEVGLKVGYSTSSHFISAFKKKYGTTPKKYLMALG